MEKTLPLDLDTWNSAIDSKIHFPDSKTHIPYSNNPYSRFKNPFYTFAKSLFLCSNNTYSILEKSLLLSNKRFWPCFFFHILISKIWCHSLDYKFYENDCYFLLFCTFKTIKSFIKGNLVNLWQKMVIKEHSKSFS